MKRYRKALLLITLSLAALLLTGCSAEVPDLSGMTEAEARHALSAAGYTASGIDYDATSTEVTWTVVTQKPQPGERAKKGTGVRLVLAGPPPLTVPDAIGVGETDAAELLKSAGFVLGSVSGSYDESVAVGVVTSQSPAPGRRAPRGVAVALVVSLGRKPVEVPAVVGEQIDGATAILVGAGFAIATETKHDGAKEGTVLSQQPAAGEVAQPGTAVSLIVSDGVEMVQVPSLYYPQYWDNDAYVGERLAEMLLPLGLKLDWGVSHTGSTDPGLTGAFYQSPKAGTWVPRGTVVTVRTPFGVAIP